MYVWGGGGKSRVLYLSGWLIVIEYKLRVDKLYTVEPLNKDTFGTSCFVLCREVVLFFRGDFL